jgi:hypothetical protein
VLCLFDLRSPDGEAQRYSTHHRSLYPNIASARQHYLFTSHAGCALCAWDLRNMSSPLYEQSRHLNHLAAPAAEEGQGPATPWPLPPADKPASCQGLWLACDEDVLLGRADNGGPAALVPLRLPLGRLPLECLLPCTAPAADARACHCPRRLSQA